MCSATADFYRRYAQSLTAAPEARRSAMLSHVERTLPPGASVLDVGAGSGRDVAAMVEDGFDAYGVEPNPDMLELARHTHPSLQSRLAHASLPHLGRPFSEHLPGGFDAVICSAVLMHLRPAELREALESMAAQLRAPTSEDVGTASPALLISLPHLDPSRLTGDRDVDGRRFHNHDADQVRAHLALHGLSLERSIDSDAVLATTGTLWKTMIFRRTG